MADGKVLEFTGVTKTFDGVAAVSDFTARVEPGHVTAFLGPNGAGKTTTLRILLGQLRATSGTATIGGKSYAQLSSPRRTVGWVSESPRFRPRRTATRHLGIVAKHAGVPLARVDEVLALVGLSEIADMRISGYSLGMTQRLAVAESLLGDPGVLVFDEPANGLDPEGIRWMRLLMRGLADEGRTVLVSSHVLSEIQQVADRLIVISNGSLVFAGGIEDLEDASSQTVAVDSPDRAGLSRVLREKGYEFDLRRSGINVQGADAAEIGAAAAAAGIALSTLQPRNPSLEDVFLRLINGEYIAPMTAALAPGGFAGWPADGEEAQTSSDGADADAGAAETPEPAASDTGAESRADGVTADAAPPAAGTRSAARAAAAAGLAGGIAAGAALPAADGAESSDVAEPESTDVAEPEDDAGTGAGLTSAEGSETEAADDEPDEAEEPTDQPEPGADLTAAEVTAPAETEAENLDGAIQAGDSTDETDDDTAGEEGFAESVETEGSASAPEPGAAGLTSADDSHAEGADAESSWHEPTTGAALDAEPDDLASDDLASDDGAEPADASETDAAGSADGEGSIAANDEIAGGTDGGAATTTADDGGAEEAAEGGIVDAAQAPVRAEAGTDGHDDVAAFDEAAETASTAEGSDEAAVAAAFLAAMEGAGPAEEEPGSDDATADRGETASGDRRDEDGDPLARASSTDEEPSDASDGADEPASAIDETDDTAIDAAFLAAMEGAEPSDDAGSEVTSSDAEVAGDAPAAPATGETANEPVEAPIAENSYAAASGTAWSADDATPSAAFLAALAGTRAFDGAGAGSGTTSSDDANGEEPAASAEAGLSQDTSAHEPQAAPDDAATDEVIADAMAADDAATCDDTTDPAESSHDDAEAPVAEEASDEPEADAEARHRAIEAELHDAIEDADATVPQGASRPTAWIIPSVYGEHSSDSADSLDSLEQADETVDLDDNDEVGEPTGQLPGAEWLTRLLAGEEAPFSGAAAFLGRDEDEDSVADDTAVDGAVVDAAAGSAIRDDDDTQDDDPGQHDAAHGRSEDDGDEALASGGPGHDGARHDASTPESEGGHPRDEAAEAHADEDAGAEQREAGHHDAENPGIHDEEQENAAASGTERLRDAAEESGDGDHAAGGGEKTEQHGGSEQHGAEDRAWDTATVALPTVDFGEGEPATATAAEQPSQNEEQPPQTEAFTFDDLLRDLSEGDEGNRG